MIIKQFRCRSLQFRCLLLLLWSCWGASLNAELLPNHASYDDIIERGTLQVAVYENFPPFSYSQAGKLQGIDVEIAKLIAQKLGVEARFRILPADETVDDDLRNAIWKGHYLGGGISDLMMHVPSNREFANRNEFVVIMGTYYQEQLVMARNLELTGETPTLAVYRFEKVGVELDSLPDFYLTGYRGGILSKNVVHYTTIDEAIDDFLEQHIAAVYAPRSQIEGALHSSAKSVAFTHDITTIFSPELLTDNWALGMAVSAHTRQLGYAIDDIMLELVNSGRVHEIFKEHGLTYTGPEFYTPSTQ